MKVLLITCRVVVISVIRKWWNLLLLMTCGSVVFVGVVVLLSRVVLGISWVHVMLRVSIVHVMWVSGIYIVRFTWIHKIILSWIIDRTVSSMKFLTTVIIIIIPSIICIYICVKPIIIIQSIFIPWEWIIDSFITA